MMTDSAKALSDFKSFLFIVPAAAIFSVFYIFPFIYIFVLSLHEWNGISPTMLYVGLDNFIELMRDRIWWDSMGRAFYITVIALTFQNALAFGLALACDREMRLKNFYRVVFFIPPVLSEVVVGFIWRWVLNAQQQGGEYFGLLNYALAKAGLAHMAHNWLSDPDTVLTCIAIVHSWKGFGWGFVIFLAGLQTIDHDLYEAARVDGAGRWRTLIHVTIPMLAPVIVLVMILTLLGSMQVFILIMSMVGQGLEYEVEVPITQILTAMLSTKQYGYASAMGIVFGLILVSVSFTFRWFSNKLKQE